MTLPKVLIFGQAFNYNTGGGITLSNLFKGWPKDRIAVVTSGHELHLATNDICNVYYQLGTHEYKWLFPFNLVQRKYTSGVTIIREKTNVDEVSKNQSYARYFIINRLFFPFLKWLGFIHFASKISLSDKLKEWLNNFKPDILYFQVASMDTILFARELSMYLKIPTTIHMMDDWPSSISTKGLFKKFWNQRIDKELKELLSLTSTFISISEAMSEEYQNRYHKKFIAIHNPIDLQNWLPFCKSDIDIDKNFISILFSGRIGYGITNSLLEIAEVIDLMRKDGLGINLYIQSPSRNEAVFSRLQKYNCVKVNPFVNYSELPKILSRADILLMSNDFNEQATKFLKYSIPTKLSEYMISGTPVLLYSPKTTAVAKFFDKYECGYCISQSSAEEIKKAINFLIENKEYRRKISRNAVEIAKEKFDADKVRNQFRQLITGGKDQNLQ